MPPHKTNNVKQLAVFIPRVSTVPTSLEPTGSEICTQRAVERSKRKSNIFLCVVHKMIGNSFGVLMEGDTHDRESKFILHVLMGQA